MLVKRNFEYSFWPALFIASCCILHRKAENGGFLFDTEEARAFGAEVTGFAQTLYELKRKDKTHKTG